MSQLFYMPFLPVPTQRGLPAGGAKAFFYKTGTTTLAPIYADADLTTQLQNPVPADGLGRLPNIYLSDDQVLRVRIVDALGGVIGADIDPYVPGAAVTIVPSLAQLMAPDGATKVGYARSVNIALPLDRSIPRTFAWAGVDPFTSASQQARLEVAMQAVADGYKLTAHPDANYRHDGVLDLLGEVDWQGASLTALSNGNNALRIGGIGSVVRNLTVRGAAAARPPQGTSVPPELSGIVVAGTDFLLDNVRASRAASGLGFPSIGIMFFGAKRGRIVNALAEYSKADGIHCTYGCEDLSFTDPVSQFVGDDGFAVVSYTGDQRLNQRIRTRGLLVRDNHARGIAIVGGNDIAHDRPRIYRSAAAAVYIASEGGDSVTFGGENYRVTGLFAQDCCSGVDLSSSFRQPLILLSGRAGTAPLADGTAGSLGLADLEITGKVVGAGTAAGAAMVVNQYVMRPRYDLLLKSMVGTNMGDAVALGGRDGSGRIFIDGCDGVPFNVGATTLGDHAYAFLGGQDTRKKAPGVADQIHGDGTTPWDSLRIDLAQFINAPGYQYGPGNLGGSNKTSWRLFRYNGAVIATPA